MLNGLRLSEPFLSVTFLVLTAIGVCAAMTSSSPHTQGEPTQSPDALAESLEKAISEGKTAKAHDLLLQVLKHPHLTSELLLRVGIQFAQHELYDDAAGAFQRCIQEHPEVFEAYYNLALTDIAQQKWEAALAILQRSGWRKYSKKPVAASRNCRMPK